MTQHTTRYQAFLRAHSTESIGKPPNHKFMAWINAQWLAFQAEHPEASVDQDAFDAWLLLQFPPPAA